MQTQATKQALAEDIKREVLMDMQRTQTSNSFNTFGPRQNYMDKYLFETIKREVLMDLEIPQFGIQQSSYRSLVEAVKRDVLAHLQPESQMNPGGFYGNNMHSDRALIDAVKRDVMAQIEAQQEAQEEMFATQQVRRNSYNSAANPALIQAVKNSVMAEMQMPVY